MNDGRDLEDFVEFVYSTLLKNENLHHAKIEKRHVETGRSGAQHEFDVFYEVSVAGLTSRVAIECKQHSRPITKGMVTEFKGKLDDCNNVTGVMVSSAGYQSGAKTFAAHYGIRILSSEELPNLYQLLATAIAWLCPDENTRGDPFWVIMQTQAGKNTGTYVTLQENTIPLFICQRAAQTVVDTALASQENRVFGVTRQHLRGLCAMSEKMGVKLAVCPLILIDPARGVPLLPYSHRDIEKAFFPK